MLALLGLLTIVTLLALIMSKRVAPVVALIGVPTVFAIFAGFSKDIGKFMVDGIKVISPTAVMFVFAVLFFGVMSDAGAFDPILKFILKIVGNDPVKIVLGALIFAMIIHLDGSGAVTFMVTIPAFLPVFKKMRMRVTTLATVVAMGAGTMNMLPWGGPTIRAATALEMTSAMDLFQPMIIPMITGLITALGIGYVLGLNEKKYLLKTYGAITEVEIDDVSEVKDSKEALKRPKLFVPNVIIILAVIYAMVTNIVAPAAAFMLGFVIAMLLNYPSTKHQQQVIKNHAQSALMMATVLFAAGIFTGIMKSTGMIKAMAEALVSILPQSLAGQFPLLVGLTSMPASLLFDPDSYYFGIMPVLASTATAVGVNPISIGYASIIGQMTTGFPISPLTPATFLLTGLVGIELGEHQKKTIPWLYLISIVMLIVSVVLRLI